MFYCRLTQENRMLLSRREADNIGRANSGPLARGTGFLFQAACRPISATADNPTPREIFRIPFFQAAYVAGNFEHQRRLHHRSSKPPVARHLWVRKASAGNPIARLRSGVSHF